MKNFWRLSKERHDNRKDVTAGELNCRFTVHEQRKPQPMNKKTVYIIAELSANHNGGFERAIEIVRAAASAGADALKLQTYTADTITLDVDTEVFRVGPGTPWEGKKLHDLYDAAHTPWEWQPKLKDEANRLGMDCISTPFDTTAVDWPRL